MMASGFCLLKPKLQNHGEPFARLSFVETCGPSWQRAKFGKILRKLLQVLAYGRTNSSSFSASGLCHLHGLKQRHDGCVEVCTGLEPASADVQQRAHNDPSAHGKTTL